MSALTKWIGGTSAAVVLALLALLFAGRSMEARAINPDQWGRTSDELAQKPARRTSPVGHARIAATAAAPSAFVIRRILALKGPIRYGEWHWDDAGVPPGPIVVTVDLDARVLSVFRDGYEIGTAAVLLGTPQHPTPIGVFPILTKQRHHVSRIYGNAPMPWTLRLTQDGVSIHGGHAVEKGWASHGCIGTPDLFAAKLFAVTRTGDKVIITNGKRAGVGSQLI